MAAPLSLAAASVDSEFSSVLRCSFVSRDLTFAGTARADTTVAVVDWLKRDTGAAGRVLSYAGDNVESNGKAWTSTGERYSPSRQIRLRR